MTLETFQQYSIAVILRPSSDAERFMSRTYFEFRPTQINKNTPVDSDVELNSPNSLNQNKSKCQRFSGKV